jgi:hypothetical protein
MNVMINAVTAVRVGRKLRRRVAKPNAASNVASRTERFAAAGHSGNDGGISGSYWANGFRQGAEAARAVVVTVIVVPVPGVTEAGLNVAAAPLGNPVTANVTGVGKAAPTVAVEIANAAGWPAATVCAGVGPETEKSAIVSVRGTETPPPGDGLNIVTKIAPPAARSPTGTSAVTCVALTIVVVSATPFHFTTVPVTKFVPVSVNVKAAPPAFAVVGESKLKVGEGLLIVNVIAEDTPPPGAGFTTVSAAVPPTARSKAGTMAVICVPLETVVARATPFHSTSEPTTKFEPVSVSVKPAPPAGAMVCESIPTVGMGLLAMPVPESSRVCGLSKASSVNVTVASRTPMAEGVNVTVMVQVALTASVAPHVGVAAKSAAFAPPRMIEAMFNVRLPVFSTATVCGAEVVVSS